MEDKIMVNGIEYVRADSAIVLAPEVDGLQYCMVRTFSAGVFAGYVAERDGKEARLLNARRIWRWAGAASLSQLATDGTSNPGECRFPVAVSEVILTDVIEIIPITAKAKASIDAVPVWKI